MREVIAFLSNNRKFEKPTSETFEFTRTHQTQVAYVITMWIIESRTHE